MYFIENQEANNLFGSIASRSSTRIRYVINTLQNVCNDRYAMSNIGLSNLPIMVLYDWFINSHAPDRNANQMKSR